VLPLIAVVVSASLASALAQQLSFTTRNALDCPVSVSSFVESKVYGFESMLVRNDGDRAITAVQLRVTLHSDAGDEVVEDRRFAVSIQPRNEKRITGDLGHVQGLTQKAKSAHQENALAILTVKQVEFEDGSSWQAGQPVEGIPALPALKRK
jgi:hypothetical protein